MITGFVALYWQNSYLRALQLDVAAVFADSDVATALSRHLTGYEHAVCYSKQV